MTETTIFPFSPPAGEDDQERTTDRRRFAVVLGAGLAAVALVGGAVFAFTGGSEVPDAATPPVVDGATGATVVEPAVATQTVPVANTESIARNPFEAKYIVPAPIVAAPVVSTPTTPTEATTDGDGRGPVPLLPASPRLVQPDPPSAAPDRAPDRAPERAPAPSAREYRLVLTSVSTDGDGPVAQFTIDGAVSSVKPTEIFGPQRQLLLRSLQQGPKDGQWTATIQVGDARPIDVVTNEAVYVQ